jgi:hypothetical protein
LERFQAHQLAQYQEYLTFQGTSLKHDPSTPERVRNSFVRHDFETSFQKPTSTMTSGFETEKDKMSLQQLASLHYDQQAKMQAQHALTVDVLGSFLGAFGRSRYPGQAFQKGLEVSGPIHCNLFVFHIPNDMTTRDLWLLFSNFGEILSCRIMVEAKTQLSRGFGFVSYDNAESAKNAISGLDGFPIGSKRLRVSHKKDSSLPSWATTAVELVKESPLKDKSVVNSLPVTLPSP